MQIIKILIAEDNLISQKLMSQLLPSVQFSCHIVTDGLQVIEALKTGTFDLILMDLQMPNMDGYTAAHVIRSRMNDRTPIIAMTAHNNDEERNKCLMHGMSGYISKPLTAEQLMETITRALTGKPEQQGQLSPEFDGNILSFSYLHALANGYEIFEKKQLEVFRQHAPLALCSMEQALISLNLQELTIAILRLKSCSVLMELSEKLTSLLPYIESEKAMLNNIVLLSEGLHEIETICRQKIPELVKPREQGKYKPPPEE